METGFFIWKMEQMPEEAGELAALCLQYGIQRLAIKVLDGTFRYNVQDGDQALQDYIDVLREAGLTVEGWGYHYPDYASVQGQAIAERCRKFELETYHVNIEKEYQRPAGMKQSIRSMLNKVPTSAEILICSYRYPTAHPGIPWEAALTHPNTDGASPQVYWALRHDPVAQLGRCFREYEGWTQKIYPIGPTFGATFAWQGEVVYWEPTVEDLSEFRQWCEDRGIPKIYYYRLGWLLSRGRFDWLEAACGRQAGPPPPPPPQPEEIVPIKTVAINASVLNVRSGPGQAFDDLGNLINGSTLPVVEEKGDWLRIEGWIHGGWTSQIS
jgi:hypothetical protein